MGDLTMEWKALANAIIHDGYDPNLKRVIIACEKCRNPFLFYSIHNIVTEPDQRSTLYLSLCPQCGNKELNLVFTANFAGLLSESMFPFVGNFMVFMGGLKEMLSCYKDEPPTDLIDWV